VSSANVSDILLSMQAWTMNNSSLSDFTLNDIENALTSIVKTLKLLPPLERVKFPVDLLSNTEASKKKKQFLCALVKASDVDEDLDSCNDVFWACYNREAAVDDLKALLKYLKRRVSWFKVSEEFDNVNKYLYKVKDEVGMKDVQKKNDAKKNGAKKNAGTSNSPTPVFTVSFSEKGVDQPLAIVVDDDVDDEEEEIPIVVAKKNKVRVSREKRKAPKVSADGDYDVPAPKSKKRAAKKELTKTEDKKRAAAISTGKRYGRVYILLIL
jgi:hypothetical protein